jgi:hypothetical protein
VFQGSPTARRLPERAVTESLLNRYQAYDHVRVFSECNACKPGLYRFSANVLTVRDRAASNTPDTINSPPASRREVRPSSAGATGRRTSSTPDRTGTFLDRSRACPACTPTGSARLRSRAGSVIRGERSPWGCSTSLGGNRCRECNGRRRTQAVWARREGARRGRVDDATAGPTQPRM